MYLTEFLASCRRRWRLAVLLVLASAALCFMAFRAISPDYEAEASVVLIPPRTTEDLAANRYLELGSLSSSVDVLARSMVSADTARMLESEVPGAEYDVTPDPTTSAPIVLMSTTSTDPAAADRMLTLLLREVPKTLNELQTEIDVQPENRITTQVVAQDPRPTVTHKARVRLVAVVAAGLLFVSGLMISAVDGLLIRRSRRQEALRARILEGSTRRRPVPAGSATKDRPSTRRTTSPPVRNGSERGPTKKKPGNDKEKAKQKPKGVGHQQQHLTGSRRGAAR